LFVENFQAVQAKQQIARLVDTSKVEMVINIPEVLISLVPQVQKVLVSYDAFPDKDIPAGVNEIGAEASETTRTYPVTLVMEQPEGFTILPGMVGEARADPASVPKTTQRKGIEVPLSAVFSPDESDKRFVWIVDEQANTISRRELVTGEIKSSGLLIEEGLSPDEWIAVAGVHYLREGQTVRLQPAQGE
jgi:RND family efflux transporter MFP subunit